MQQVSPGIEDVGITVGATEGFICDRIKTISGVCIAPKDNHFTIWDDHGIEDGHISEGFFPEAAILVVRTNTASVSMFQRHFKIGYARAGRIIDLLERAQIIGPHLGSKSRDVLANREDLIRMGLIKEEE